MGAVHFWFHQKCDLANVKYCGIHVSVEARITEVKYPKARSTEPKSTGIREISGTGMCSNRPREERNNRRQSKRDVDPGESRNLTMIVGDSS